MSHSYAIYADVWEPHNSKHVRVNGLDCTLVVQSWDAIYPVPKRVITVSAVPTEQAKQTEFYRERKSFLGDDWLTDILDSDIEFQAAVLKQLEGAGDESDSD